MGLDLWFVKREPLLKKGEINRSRMISPRMEPEGGEFSAVRDGGRGGVSMERRGCKELGKCNQYFKVIFCLFKIDICIQVIVESQAVVRNTTKDAVPPLLPCPAMVTGRKAQANR